MLRWFGMVDTQWFILASTLAERGIKVLLDWNKHSVSIISN